MRLSRPYYKAPHPFAKAVVAVAVAGSLAIGCSRRVEVDPERPTHQTSGPTVDVTPEDRAGHQQMITQLKQLGNAANQVNRYYGDGFAQSMRQLQQAGALTDSPTKRLQFDFQLGMAELKLGNCQEAIELLESGYQRAQSLRATRVISGNTLLEATFRVGLAYLRLGETENCCLRHNADSCLLPIREGGLHQRQEGSRTAIRYFQELLESASERNKLYYETVWLLNIAYMTLGEHPQKVPRPISHSRR